MDKTIIDLGFINITWYAFLIVGSLVIGAIIVKNNKKVKAVLTEEQIYDYFFYLVLFSIIGARLWYVFFSFNQYMYNPLEIFAVWHGGLAIHGGIFAGLIYTLYYATKHAFSTFILTDAIVPALLLGQAIGRWGNFVNQEAHGPATTYDFLKNTLHLPLFIVDQMKIDGVYYQPTFLYESLWNIVGFLIVILILKKIWNNKLGYITSFYLIWYGFIRFFIEMLRTDALMFGPIKIAQFSSIMMFISGFILFIFLYLNNKKNKDSFK